MTYGVGAIGQKQPRTAHSFIPEFEAELNKKAPDKETANGNDSGRIPVKDFAQALSDFFMRQWKQHMPENVRPGNDMAFLVGGYDEGEPYGRVFELFVPSKPEPVERHAGDFGMVWGGQREYTDRLILGYDPRVLELVRKDLGLTEEQRDAIEQRLKVNTQAPIPFQFLPLQDCVDLSIMLIRTTITLQNFIVGVRGVGGAIDVATITRTEGLKDIQSKRTVGEHGSRE